MTGSTRAEAIDAEFASLPERFRVVSVLGRGGMGVVLEAHDTVVDRLVAIKVMRASAATRPESASRMFREAQILAKLRSAHFVELFDVGTLADGRPYLVMERLQGRPLNVALERSPMTPSAAAALAIPICQAMAEAHAAGIVHRDIKPSNLFLAADAVGGVTVKVLDFGIARAFGAEPGPGGASGTTSGQVFGSPGYMAPEQARGETPLDERVDIWSLGVVLYEAMSGRAPFAASTPADALVRVLREKPVPLRRLARSVPPGLASVVHACLEKERERRPRSAAELAALLRPYGDASDLARFNGRSSLSPETPSNAGDCASASVTTVSSVREAGSATRLRRVPWRACAVAAGLVAAAASSHVVWMRGIDGARRAALSGAHASRLAKEAAALHPAEAPRTIQAAAVVALPMDEPEPWTEPAARSFERSQERTANAPPVKPTVPPSRAFKRQREGTAELRLDLRP